MTATAYTTVTRTISGKATAIIAIHLAGCTTLRPVESHHSALSPALRAGDEVRMSTHDGRSREFKIAAIVVVGVIVAAARAPFFYWPAPHFP